MEVCPARSIKYKPHRFAAQFRELDAGERLHMEQSLDQYGFDPSIPIRIGSMPSRKTKFLVDGIQRLDVAQEHNLDVAIVERVYESDKEVVAEIVRLNLARRHLKTDERTEIAAIAVREGGFSARAAAKEAGVSDMSVLRKLMEGDPTSTNVADGSEEKRKGQDGKLRPGKRRNKEEQRIWDIQADHLAQELGSNKAAAESLGVQPQTISNARKRVAAMADQAEEKLPVAKNDPKDDPMLRTLSSAWTNYSRIDDPEDKFIAAFLAGVRGSSVANATAWTQAWADWKAQHDDNKEAGA